MSKKSEPKSTASETRATEPTPPPAQAQAQQPATDPATAPTDPPPPTTVHVQQQSDATPTADDAKRIAEELAQAKADAITKAEAEERAKAEAKAKAAAESRRAAATPTLPALPPGWLWVKATTGMMHDGLHREPGQVMQMTEAEYKRRGPEGRKECVKA